MNASASPCDFSRLRAMAVASSLSLLFLGIAVASCSLATGLSTKAEHREGTGRLSVSFGSTLSRTILPSIDMAAASYDASGIGPDGASFSTLGISGGGFDQDGLASGGWTISIQAKNAAGAIIGSGSGATTVTAGQTSSCTIAILPLSGDGSFACALTWPAASLATPAVEGTLTDASDASLSLSFDLTSGAADTGTIMLPSGYYRLAIAIKEGPAVRFSKLDAIRIVSGNATVARFDLAASDISVNRLFAPRFGLAGGSYTGQQTLSLSSPQGGSILYTTNGCTPTSANGIAYTGPIQLSGSVTIKAIAAQAGYIDSQPQCAVFIIDGTPAAPTFGLEEGLYFSPQQLSLAAGAPVDGFTYTVDGSAPVLYAVGSQYSSPISIGAGTTIVKAISNIGDASSAISVATYRVTGYASQPIVSAPSYDSDQAITATLAPAGSGETIYYTTDGSAPSASSGTLYASPITIAASCTLKAVAVKADWGDSTIASRDFKIRCKPPASSVAPDTYATPQTIDLNCLTGGASILYTLDGGDPSAGTVYSAPFVLENPATIRAVASKGGIGDSTEFSMTIAYRCAAPTCSLPPGTYDNDIAPTLGSATAGASIRYTINGVVPSSSSGALYSGSSIAVNKSLSIKAIAYRTGWQDSTVSDTAYSFACSPVAFGPAARDYSDATIPVTLSTSTAGAAIYYTTNGATPTAGSTPYGGSPFTLSGSATVKAVAVKANYSNSTASSAAYALGASPTTPATVYEQKPLIAWPATFGAQGYRLEVYDGAVLVEQAEDVASPGYRLLSALASGKTYSWRYAAKSGVAYGGWQGPYSISVMLVPTSGLVGEWLFSGNPADTSGNGNNGTAYGATLAVDRFGSDSSAYSFGTGKYINMGNPANGKLDLVGDFTLCCWIKARSWSDISIFVGRDDGPGGCNKWGLGYITNYSTFQNMITFTIANPAAWPADPWVNSSAVPLALNTWVFLAVKRINFDYYLYCDGNLVGTEHNEAIDPIPTSGFGVSFWEPAGGTFDGCVDDVRKYDRALSDPEILALYHENGWAP